jgi:hypothetical protein
MRLTPTAVLAFVLAAGCIVGSRTAAVAGTTGSISGSVVDAKTHAPVPGAVVGASSPTQIATAITDAKGRFVLISLLPDTYVIAVSKQGFESHSLTGITVFADSTQTLEGITLQPSLRTIGTVTARSSLDLVKPGTTTDVYSVDSATTDAAAVAGGGGSLNSAYSALAVLPGLFVPPNQQGVNQTVYIRGGYYDQIGYEYDGVPVNRSFDNYPGHSAATIGEQELQLYTGGGDADANATGLAGFINQVAKSGTYPGYEIVSGRLGYPTFYHDLSGEISGATTNRLFTYYVGTSGYDQAYRYFDNSNGAGLTGTFPYYYGSNQTTYLDFYPAVYPTCTKDLAVPSSYNPPAGIYSAPGCFAALNPAYADISNIEDRDWVANFHLHLPHRSGGLSDDIQLLYTNSAQFRQYYSGPNDAGYTPAWNDSIGPPIWPDAVTFPAGTQFLAPANTPAVAYPYPGSPLNRCYNTLPIVVQNTCATNNPSLLPDDYRDGRWDTASIVKLQYQKNVSPSAYVRVFGYTFYSNTARGGASGLGIGSGFAVENYDYEVDTHTRGAELQFGDQLSSRNMLTGSANFVTATTNRVNNYNFLNDENQQVSNLTNGKQCFAYYSGYLSSDPGDTNLINAGAPAPCNDPITQGFFGAQTEGQPVNCAGNTPSNAIPQPACAAGAAWKLTYTGNQGPLNQVVPKNSSLALKDEWKPNDRLNVNLGLRLERDEYDLANTDTPGKNFWFAAAQNEFCYNLATLQPVIVPQPPQDISVVVPYVALTCPQGTAHPDGKDGHLLLSNVYNPVIVQTFAEPRGGATYTLDPNTVLRVSAGRYVQQPQAYEVQYNSNEENLAAQLMGFLPYGFTTPRHDAYPQYSNNFDASFEHRFKNSDVSLKLTPYFRYATNQLYSTTAAESSISLNTGIESTRGVEMELVKGDFSKNGLSMLFSYTYTLSKEKWANFENSTNNPVDLYNDDITQFNMLTKAGGGAPCYATSSDGSYSGDPTCAPTSIRNPYYGMKEQPLFDRNGWYDTGLDYPYIVPNNFSVVLNYRRLKWAFTPVVTLNQGATYGNPADVTGVDPRTCLQNQLEAGITSATDPLKADYTSCGFAATPTGSLYVPNPETGHFDAFGEFRQPWQLNVGLGVTYSVTPRASFNLTVANLFNRCFGGSSTAWTQATPPSGIVCGYNANPFYIDNFYNGASPNDVAANGVPLNPYFAHSFVAGYADTNTYNYAMPLSMYLRFSLKL